jgi:hypothetical protein
VEQREKLRRAIKKDITRKCVVSYPPSMAPLNQLATVFYFLPTVLNAFVLSSPPLSVSSVCILIATSTAFTGTAYDMGSGGTLTREIEIKQGRLVGLRFQSTSNPGLRPVEVFLGIPYAAAPTGSQRFMPPGSPPQWMGVKFAHNFGPVCPQNLPDLNEKNRNTVSEGRAKYLRRLFPYLMHNQSEDCLYLNIYAPAQKWGEYRHNPVNSTDGLRLKHGRVICGMTYKSIVVFCVKRL